MRTLISIIGVPCSGKTTLINQLKEKLDICIFDKNEHILTESYENIVNDYKRDFKEFLKYTKEPFIVQETPFIIPADGVKNKFIILSVSGNKEIIRQRSIERDGAFNESDYNFYLSLISDKFITSKEEAFYYSPDEDIDNLLLYILS